MAMVKTGYAIVDSIKYYIPDEVIKDCVSRAHGPDGVSKLLAIKYLRDESRSVGPFGIEVVMGLRDAKSVIEDWMENNPKG